MTSAILTRLCRSCGRSSREAKFATKHRCVGCADTVKAERAERIAERGARLPPAVVDNDGSLCPKHLAWVRRQKCCVLSRECSGPIHAHHVRSAATAGTGLKPPDAACVSLCAFHHSDGHTRGWTTFETEHGINLRDLAARIAAISPHLK